MQPSKIFTTSFLVSMIAVTSAQPNGIAPAPLPGSPSTIRAASPPTKVTPSHVMQRSAPMASGQTVSPNQPDKQITAPAAPVPAIQSAHVVSVKNGDTITLALSNRETNRLLVANDQLAGVVCPPTVCHANVSRVDPTHSTYITIPSTATTPFTLHVSTLAHRYFSLHVVPRQQPGTTVLITPQSPGVASALTHNGNSWTTRLTNLIKAMMQQQRPDDYDVIPYLHRKATRIHPGIEAKKIVTWCNETLCITRYQLINTTPHTIRVTESEFYQSGVVAVALSDQQLRPAGGITLYEVNNHRTGGNV